MRTTIVQNGSTRVVETQPPGVVTVNVGRVGPRGPAGETGAKGDPGDPGEQGVQGEKGDTGDTGPAGADGRTWLSGSGAPSNALGEDGDFYLEQRFGVATLYGPKAAGSWPAGVVLNGAAGANGKTIYSGAGEPPSATGTAGDFWLDTATTTLHGPKIGGTWVGAASVSLIGPAGADGEQGPAGADGDPGAPGADGKTWHQGTGAPDAGLGVDGDMYLDTAASTYYVRTGGSWGAGTVLVGPTGEQGPKGDTGDTGPQGPAGPGLTALQARWVSHDFYLGPTGGAFGSPAGSTQVKAGDGAHPGIITHKSVQRPARGRATSRSRSAPSADSKVWAVALSWPTTTRPNLT